MARTFSERLYGAKLITTGAKNDLESLAQIGVSKEDIAEIEEQINQVEQLNTKQEELKALLKTSTAELTKNDKKLSEMTGALKKRIKLVIPQARWKAFGIADKK